MQKAYHQISVLQFHLKAHIKEILMINGDKNIFGVLFVIVSLIKIRNTSKAEAFLKP